MNIPQLPDQRLPHQATTTRTFLFLFASIGCLISTLLALSPNTSYAATSTVTNTNNSGPGSLRQIIADATAGDTITFDTSLSGQTIVLSQTLTIDKDLTIDGSALSTPLTLSGNQRVLVLMVKTGVTASLHHLIVADGNRSAIPPAPLPSLLSGLYIGAGLQNDGTVTLDRLTFQYNRTSGTKGEGGQGGAIGNNGVLTVTNSFFWNNSGGSGSGILNEGHLYVADSTFADNVATNGWGGGRGGAIDNTGTLTVTNSTFSRNMAFGGYGAPGGGAINNTGMAWLLNSTFSDNRSTAYRANEGAGSGIANRGTMHLYNTIIANGIDSADCSGILTTNINNLIEDGSCGAAFSGDPLLGPLVDYGGATFTQALLPGSPAIDAGDNTTCPTTDQRGVVRPFDGDNDGSVRCDIGAYEAVTPVLATVTATATPTFTPTPIPPTPTNTPPPTHTPTITHTPTPTATPTPTGTPTSTGMPTFTPTATRFVPPLPTGEHHFDVRVYVVSSAAVVHVGETVTVTVTVDNQSIGCIYPVYTLMLSQVGDPLFHFASPTTVSEPIGEQTIYTLTAIATGAVALQATATGEQFCGAYWQPSSINGATYPVTVLAQVTPTPTAIPTITITPTIITTPTILPTATQTITMTARRGDSNGDELIDGADIVACIQEIFDNDGTLSPDAPDSSYVTGSLCDTNQDAVIDAGDISCTSLLRVDGQHLCGADMDQSTGQTVATLTIAGDRTGTGGATVQLPISLNTNGATVTAAAFRLQFDSAYLSFDPSDHNGDALPDALTLIQPPLVSQPLITVTAHSDALDIALTDLATPPGSWYDGVFLIINLRVHKISSNAPLTTTVAFAPSVLPSLGSASGTSLPVQAVNGVVRLLPAVPMRQYLPLIRQQ